MSRRSDLLPPMSRTEWVCTTIVLILGAALLLWGLGTALVFFLR